MAIQLDKMTRDAIAATVARATMEAQEMYSERWVTGEELCRELGCFTPQFLKLYGRSLPRECVRVTDAEGNEHRTRWCYPLRRIRRMMGEGKLRELTIDN